MITSRVLQQCKGLARCIVKQQLRSPYFRYIKTSLAVHNRFLCIKPSVDDSQIDSATLAPFDGSSLTETCAEEYKKSGEEATSDSMKIQAVLRDIDQFARQQCKTNGEKDFAFFKRWWNDLYSQLMSASSKQICLLTGALGLVNLSCQEELRRRDLLMRSHIHCLETQFLLGDDEALDSRFFATLYVGLQRLYEYDNFGSMPYPAVQLVSRTVQYFANKASQPDAYTKSAMAQFVWSLSQMKTCPVDNELEVITSLLHRLIVENREIIEAFSSLPSAGEGELKQVDLDTLIDICVQHVQVATSYLEWRVDPNEKMSSMKSGGDAESADFWRDWYSVAKLIINIYLTDSIDWSGKKDAMSFEVNTLLGLLCYDCLEVASEFDMLSDLFACETFIAQVLTKCLSEHNITFSSEVVLAFERAIDNISTKCKAKAVMMGIDKKRIPTCPVLSYNQLAAKVADLAQTIREKVAQHTARSFQDETLVTPYVLKRFYLTIGASIDHLLDVLRQKKGLHDYMFLVTPQEGDAWTSIDSPIAMESLGRAGQSQNEQQDWIAIDANWEEGGIKKHDFKNSRTAMDEADFKNLLLQHSSKTSKRR